MPAGVPGPALMHIRFVGAAVDPVLKPLAFIFLGATRELLCRIAPANLVQLHENVKEKAEPAKALRLEREEKESSNKCKKNKKEEG